MDDTITIKVPFQLTRDDMVECLALASEYGLTAASQRRARALAGYMTRNQYYFTDSPPATPEEHSKALAEAEALVARLWPTWG